MSIQISAIICALHHTAYLDKAIQSLINQTLPKEQYEIIVVSSGSIDETKMIGESFNHLENFRCIHEPIKGLSQARNMGWQDARGEYVAYLDDDAIASPEWLERIVNAFETIRPPPGGVGGKIIPIWEGKRPDWLSKQLEAPLTILNWGDRPIFLTEEYQYLAGANVSYRREILQNIGGFCTNLGRKGNTLLSNEERLLDRTLRKQGLGLYYDPKICVRHHIKVERLVKSWFYKRFFWQGVSDVILQYNIENAHNETKSKYLYRAMVNAFHFIIHPMNTVTIILPARTSSCVERKCSLYCRIGEIWTQTQIGVGQVKSN
jgi:glycosyltransferase involved in cell wall biosynthesis